jgi:putative tricarboxylic transport membrane protein
VKNDIPEYSGSGEGKEKQSPLSFVDGTDFVLALIILAVCGFLYYISTRFDTASEQMSQNIPPEWFPQLLLVFIMVLTLAIPFEHLFKGKKLLAKDRQARVKSISIGTAALLCAIIFLMPWLGTFLTMVCICIFLPLLWGERRLRILLPFAIVFPGLVTLLFTKVLRVYFEAGIWSKFF